MNPSDRVRVGGVPMDAVTLEEALSAIERLVSARRGGAVFTPNVDHVVLCDQNPSLREAYEAADLSLVDGMPVLWASRLLRRPLPEKVSGSDLVLPLARMGASRGWSFLLLGGGAGVAERAGAELQRLFPGFRVAGTLAPRIDLTEPAASRRSVVEAIRRAEPQIVLVALGAPKQELWIHEVRSLLAPAVFLGIGASLDFIAGTATRAPGWMSNSGLEWLYRLAREPRRLWKRYLVRDPVFLAIVMRDLVGLRRQP